MKKILFWLITLIWLCWINFSSAWSYTYSWTFYFNTRVSWWNVFLVNPVPLISSYYNSNITVSCTLSNFSSSLDWKQFTFRFYKSLYDYFDGQSAVWVQSETINALNNYTFVWTDTNVSTYWFVSTSSVNVWSSFDYSCTVSWDNIINQSDIWWGNSCDYSWYILETNVTENYCTNKFSNLIDESDITSWYCETEFWLIDPENCPSSWWTGDVLWSSFWVNDRQIEGASNIYLYMPDFLSWDYTYLNSGATLQIDVDNEGDQDYINKLLTIETYHPTSDEFAVSFVWYLTLLMPYIVITLFIAFIWKLIKRVFK